MKNLTILPVAVKWYTI